MPSDTPPTTGTPRKKRLLRNTMIIMVVLGITLVLAGWILTRESVLKPIFESSLSSRLGARVQIEHAQWTGGTDVLLEGISIQSEDLPGDPGNIASIKDLRATIWLPGIIGSGSLLSSIDVGPARLRIAENIQSQNDVNVARLFSGEGDGGVPDLPGMINLPDLTVETGTFHGSQWTLSETFHLQGGARPDPVVEGTYKIMLEETEVDGPGKGISLEGTFDRINAEFEATFTDIPLNSKYYSILPRHFRDYCYEMRLKGEVEQIYVRYGRGEPPRAEVDLKEVALTVPAAYGLDTIWARFENQHVTPSPAMPRMIVDDGRITFTVDSLTLNDLHGRFISEDDERIAEVPFALRFAATWPRDDLDLDDEQWMTTVLDESAFSLELRTDQFHLGTGEGEPDRADLPIIVARILAMFQVRSCDVGIQLNASRALMSERTTPDEFKLEGEVRISNASGAYEGFPYPLEQLGALISFDTVLDETVVRVRNLDANGAGGAQISISGDVVPLNDGSEVDLVLRAANLPLDSNLINAMPPEASHTLRSLFGRHGVEQPAEKKTALATHEFVDLNLQILRERGPDHPTRLQGTIGFEHLEMTWDTFPYPITLEAGNLIWEGDELRLAGPDQGGIVKFKTPSGIEGEAQGVIRLPLSDEQASGTLDLMVIGEPMTQDLIDSLHVLVPDVAELVEALQIEGTLSVVGPIDVDGQGNVSYRLVIRIDDAVVRPRDELAAIIGATSAFWEHDFELRDVHVELEATQEQVNIISCTGSNDRMTFTMDGTYRLDLPELTDIDIRVEHAPLQDRLVDLAPEGMRESVQRLYDRWDPRGDISLDAHVRGRGPGSTTVVLDEATARLQIGESTQQLRIVGGSLSVDASSINMQDLEIDSFNDDIPDGQFSLSGSSSWGDDVFRTNLQCRLFGGQFESPLLMDLASAFAGEEVVSLYSRAGPSGDFTAEAHVTLEPGLDIDWSLFVKPENILATYRDTEMSAVFERGDLQIRNGSIRLADLAGTAGDSAFRVSGRIEPGEKTTADLVFDFDGRIRSPELVALMPDLANDVLDGIEFEDGSRSSTRSARLKLAFGPGDDRVSAHLVGDLVVDGASVTAGPRFGSINGMFSLDINVAPDRPARFQLEGRAGSMTIYERPVIDARVKMRLDADGDRVLLEELSGNLGGGELYVEGTCQVDRAPEWSVHVLISDAGLASFMKVDSSEDQAEADEPPEGRLFASIAMKGTADDPGSRLAQGRVRIFEGALRPLPVMVGIYQLLQLSLPVVDAPEFVDVAFHTVGEDIVLDKIRIESHAGDLVLFSLNGSGVFDWNTQQVKAVLRPRSGVLVLRDVLGALQDHIYAIGIEGPVEDPEVRVITFPGMQEDEMTSWVPPL